MDTMSETRSTYLSLPHRIHRMACVAAARLGISMSEYVATILLEESVRNGVADFVRGCGDGNADEETESTDDAAERAQEG